MIRIWRNSGIRLERNVALKVQNYVETVSPSLLDVRTDEVMRNKRNLLRTYKISQRNKFYSVSMSPKYKLQMIKIADNFS